jgi:hypothetical protein
VVLEGNPRCRVIKSGTQYSFWALPYDLNTYRRTTQCSSEVNGSLDERVVPPHPLTGERSPRLPAADVGPGEPASDVVVLREGEMRPSGPATKLGLPSFSNILAQG